MKVDTGRPFQIIYSLYEHQFLGYLFESYAVQLDDAGRVTLQTQNISEKNSYEFAAAIDAADAKLIKLIDEIQQESVVKKFAARKMTTAEFFFKVYDPSKGDKAVQEQIDDYLERRKAEMLPLMIGKPVFEMSSDGQPTWKRLEVPAEPAHITFNLKRHPGETHYWPRVKVDNQIIKLRNRNGLLVCYHPAWLLLDGQIMHFSPQVDGSKIKPFLTKDHIVIPKAVEDKYYKTFVKQLLEDYKVRADGLTIISEPLPMVPKLQMMEWAVGTPAAQLILADGDDEADEPAAEEDGQSQIRFEIFYEYGPHRFNSDKGHDVDVKVFQENDEYTFHKTRRDRQAEAEVVRKLMATGLPLRNGKALLNRNQALAWAANAPLQDLGIAIEQNHGGKDVRYFLGKTRIDLRITENRDWFDIQAVVLFGTFEVPFLRIRQLMLQKKREFVLPNGELAVIPEEWFSQYADLLAFSHEDRDNASLTLHKMHLAVVDELRQGELASVSMSQRLQQLSNFAGIDSFDLPAGFKGQLRPYQKAGYDWMLFLNSYRLGGCLADDMGLGKTVQTLSLLQHQKENGVKVASLLVVPTSLIYNWEVEARKFVPGLRILIHTGTYRQKDVTLWQHYDLVLTSYGTVRADIDLLEQYHFNYVILDESQAIKNPGSAISKAVLRLKSLYRLILTGTPLENSTMDLWAQMNFVNPGLLGGQTFFRNQYLTPIERKQDEKALGRLHNLIKPFILRRTKQQVATELPPKTELIQYVEMTEEQHRLYEETKSSYRNQIMEAIEQQGVGKTQLFVLQGLTHLRQLANHPAMVDPAYEGGSAKLDDVVFKLEAMLEKKHKLLIFSQFVKHLSLVRTQLEARNIPYAYLDGSTRDRQAQVERFQNDPNVQVFLISLKAGGVGLNLTAADYVFLLDPWWNPAVEAQAVDRAHRIGQDKKVFIYKFITRDTVEEKILTLQRSKMALVNELITTEETFVKNLTKGDIEALLG